MRKPWRDEQLSEFLISRRIELGKRVELTSDATDLLNHAVDHLLANGVVTTGIYSCQSSFLFSHVVPARTVVGSIFLAADQQLRVEELAVWTSSDLVDWLHQSVSCPVLRYEAAYRRVQVDEDGTRDVFAATSLSEEGLVGSALAEFLRIGVGTTIRQ